jgi:hypothetical protein
VSYRNVFQYLQSKTAVYELCDQFGGRVAVCPDWNARVMTSSCGGFDGYSYGFVNVNAIDAASPQSLGLNILFGGEDQLAFSPESGPFSLYYVAEIDKPDKHIQLPAGFHEGPFDADYFPQSNEIRMRRGIQMTNLAGASFDLDLVRTVRLLELNTIRSVFGNAVAVSLEQTDVSYIGFSSANSMVNMGTSHSKMSGLVSFRIRSMFNAGQDTVAVVPFQPGDDDWGSPVNTNYFGSSPHGRLRLTTTSALLRADGKRRCQLTVPPRRTVPFAGSIDFREGTLTLLSFDLSKHYEHFSVSDESEEMGNVAAMDFVDARTHYVEESVKKYRNAQPSDENNYNDIYFGDILRAYNNGPAVPGDTQYPQYYEFNTHSPARELLQKNSLVYHQHTLHINADNRTLEFIVQKLLDTDYEDIYKKMIQ